MKSIEKNQAIELRRQGLTLKKISEKLKVAKGTVSNWVKNIQLTAVQIAVGKINNSHLLGSTHTREKYRKIREEYQKEGSNKAEEKNWLHISGCMLYWAEGAKDKNSIIFVNSDINMMKLFLNFLRTFFNVRNHQISLQIYCYDGNGIEITDIENYWITNLSLTGCILKKTYVKHAPTIYGKRGKLNYGTCRMKINNTKIVQHIFGAIQKYAGFYNELWLTGY